jgi:hypothetical protein
MGKQTDAHITAVNSELLKLKTALDHLDTAKKGFGDTWTQMMDAYDHKGGKSASSAFGGKLLTQATNYDGALTNAKAALTAAQHAVTTMDTFVAQKDKTTINPLAKKSIGKAKKFVVTAKADLVHPAGDLAGRQGLMGAYNLAKTHYL